FTETAGTALGYRSGKTDNRPERSGGSPLEDGGDALPSRRADRNQRPLLHLCRQFLGGEAQDARARRREWMTIGKTGPLRVELAAVNRSHRRVAAEDGPAVVGILPRLERAKHLGGESLVDFIEVEILKRQPGTVQHARDRDGGSHQQTVAMR